jgi:hypothetical protein
MLMTERWPTQLVISGYSPMQEIESITKSSSQTLFELHPSDPSEAFNILLKQLEDSKQGAFVYIAPGKNLWIFPARDKLVASLSSSGLGSIPC